MSQQPPSTRRDPRSEPWSGTATLEFQSAGQLRRAGIASVSATGLAFTLEGSAGVEVGSTLAPATIQVDDLRVEGELSVRYCRPSVDSRFEFGCLFFSASVDHATRWMELIDGRSSVTTTVQPHLPIRCSTCHHTLWVSNEPTGHCRACNQQYDLGRSVGGRRLEDVHRRARELAAELEIDLPSAASMLLGILTLSEVQDVLDYVPAPEPTLPASETGRTRTFDPAFKPAIEAGTLTVAQAAQRGKREAFARNLVARHLISLEEAYAIADNRTSLLTVKRKRSAGKPIAVARASPRFGARFVAVAACNLVVLLACLGAVSQLDDAGVQSAVTAGTAGLGRGPNPAAATDAARPANTLTPVPPGQPDLSSLPVSSYARVQTDDRGRTTRVEATDPLNVLLALCNSPEAAGRWEPIDVVPTVPPSDTARLGVLRVVDAAPDYRAVIIRQDPRTRRWFVVARGGPNSEIALIPAPQHVVPAAERTL